MQVILRKQIEKLGHTGDVKDVSAGYFRNFLFPRGLAQLATAAGLKQAERMRADAAQKQMKDRDAFTTLVGALQKERIVLTRKATEEGHLFGSVAQADIAGALGEKGYSLEEKQIVLEAHIKELGTYPILLKFDDAITGTISITVERDPS
ncbi:MAG: 50S ribosomal protein L9 [Candidatus Ryanbacteria bacterium RIFCSPHIGHO2_02_FULL_45_13b]|uniref:Large ribosomal subunit protein bL9 n=1 Tax=Candidatus Ryanbacteria bacterium RIFCSPHIGHO2_02_FULL_45_13b TaxID=1802117 RepID=A0A1G2G9E2_9BACT|nr:MAG: 50S ribosomal protein L9 [Candidatus Ryanbacteria bacterium RIFCSPHIGHO2_02_FULL_45_13b]